MNYILVPDKNNSILKNYHKSSKLLIPGICASYICNKYDIKPADKIVHSFNIINFAFHSYVSTSCIITDYLKPKTISNICRSGNLAGHLFATIGYIYYVKKNY